MRTNDINGMWHNFINMAVMDDSDRDQLLFWITELFCGRKPQKALILIDKYGYWGRYFVELLCCALGNEMVAGFEKGLVCNPSLYAKKLIVLEDTDNMSLDFFNGATIKYLLSQDKYYGPNESGKIMGFVQNWAVLCTQKEPLILRDHALKQRFLEIALSDMRAQELFCDFEKEVDTLKKFIKECSCTECGRPGRFIDNCCSDCAHIIKDQITRAIRSACPESLIPGLIDSGAAKLNCEKEHLHGN